MERTLMYQIQSVCQGLAYGIYDSVKSFREEQRRIYQDMFEKNLIVETLHAMNRQTLFRQSFIPNYLVDTSVAYTLNWLVFYRLEAQELFNTPEWGKEYTPTKKAN